MHNDRLPFSFLNARALRRGRVITGSASLLLASCAAPTIVDENSHLYPPPVGTVVELHTDVRIAPDRARATIQRGAVSPTGVHPFAVWCQLEVRDVLPAPQVVHADTFRVHKVGSETTQVVETDSLQHVAGVDVQNQGSSDVTRIWHLWLTSERQPNVLRMSCGGAFDAPYWAEFPSVQEIRATLGAVASLHLPQTNPSPPSR